MKSQGFFLRLGPFVRFTLQQPNSARGNFIFVFSNIRASGHFRTLKPRLEGTASPVLPTLPSCSARSTGLSGSAAPTHPHGRRSADPLLSTPACTSHPQLRGFSPASPECKCVLAPSRVPVDVRGSMWGRLTGTSAPAWAAGELLGCPQGHTGLQKFQVFDFGCQHAVSKHRLGRQGTARHGWFSCSVAWTFLEPAVGFGATQAWETFPRGPRNEGCPGRPVRSHGLQGRQEAWRPGQVPLQRDPHRRGCWSRVFGSLPTEQTMAMARGQLPYTQAPPPSSHSAVRAEVLSSVARQKDRDTAKAALSDPGGTGW